MYNALIKQDYINQYTGITGNNTFQNLFSSTEVYEIMWNKDVCNFVRDEIIEYLRSIGATSVSTLATKVSLLRNYTYWCCENQFTKDGINHFNEILPDDYYDCVNKKEATTIMTEEEIIEVLDQLINPSEQFLVMCLYEGIKGENFEEIINMKEEDIDDDTKTVKLISGKIVEVGDTFIKVAHRAANTYKRVATKGDSRSYELSTGPYVLRPNIKRGEDKVKFPYIRQRLHLIREITDNKNLTAPKLLKFGMYNKLSKLASAKNVEVIDTLTMEDGIKIIERYGYTRLTIPQIRSFMRKVENLG